MLLTIKIADKKAARKVRVTWNQKWRLAVNGVCERMVKIRVCMNDDSSLACNAVKWSAADSGQWQLYNLLGEDGMVGERNLF